MKDFENKGVAKSTKKKKRRGGGRKAVGAVMYVLMIIGISLIISSFASATVNDVFALVSDGDRSVTLVFSEESTSVKEVAEALEDSGMIRYKWAFRLYAGLKNAGDFKAGTFEIKDSYDFGQIIDTCNTYPFKHTFLQDIPMIENRLEGYLFPDTYEFYVNESPVQAANKMLNNFDRRYTTEMREHTEKAGLTIHEVVIMASLVEKEAKLATERATISGVIYNRLKNKANFPYLQIDATVLYALNKTDALTEEDLKVESPYNTYVTEGLPPTAICSPGVSCLLAAILPEEHRYYYYVVDINSEIKGQHIFSKTLAEHNNAIANMKK